MLDLNSVLSSQGYRAPQGRHQLWRVWKTSSLILCSSLNFALLYVVFSLLQESQLQGSPSIKLISNWHKENILFRGVRATTMFFSDPGISKCTKKPARCRLVHYTVQCTVYSVHEKCIVLYTFTLKCKLIYQSGPLVSYLNFKMQLSWKYSGTSKILESSYGTHYKYFHLKNFKSSQPFIYCIIYIF